MSNWLKLKELGNKEYQKENYLEAQNYYTKAIELDSSQDVLYSNRALTYIQTNNLEKAEKDLIIAIEKNQINIKAIKRLGNLYKTQGKLHKAKEYIEKATNLDNDNKIEHTEYSFNNNEINKINDLIENDVKAKHHNKIKEFKESLNLTTILLNDCPNYTEIKSLHVDNLIENSLFVEANTYLKSSLSEEERNNDMFIRLTCKLLYYEGKYEKVKSLINNVMTVYKQKDNTYYKNILSNIDLIEEYKIKGKEQYIKGNFNQSIDVYKKIINIDPNNKSLLSTAYFNISLCKQKLSEFTEALAFADKSILYNPKYTNAFFRRGMINFEMKCYEDAKRDFSKVLEIDPSFREAKIKLSEIEMEKEKQKRKDYYKILDISYNSNDYEIRQAYRKLAAKWHPDKNNTNEKSLMLAKSMFADITEAYDILSDKEKRRLYDSGKSFYHYNNENYHEEEENEDYIQKKAGEIYYKNKK